MTKVWRIPPVICGPFLRPHEHRGGRSFIPQPGLRPHTIARVIERCLANDLVLYGILNRSETVDVFNLHFAVECHGAFGAKGHVHIQTEATPTKTQTRKAIEQSGHGQDRVTGFKAGEKCGGEDGFLPFPPYLPSAIAPSDAPINLSSFCSSRPYCAASSADRMSGSDTISANGTPARLKSSRLCDEPDKLEAP